MKSAAILTIKDAADMTEKGRRDIAEWLCKQAEALMDNGHLYSKKTTIRYLYAEGIKNERDN